MRADDESFVIEPLGGVVLGMITIYYIIQNFPNSLCSKTTHTACPLVPNWSQLPFIIFLKLKRHLTKYQCPIKLYPASSPYLISNPQSPSLLFSIPHKISLR